MLRRILSTICFVELAAPEALVDAAEQLSLENPNECERKSWVVPGARVEGVVLLFVMWRSDASYSRFKKFLGSLGTLALLCPQAYIDYSAGLAYTDAADCRWKPWVYPATRFIGLLYVIIAFDELRKG